jgi:catechol 2,3-dioxygenase-like lactoylglutathione lyase family enzyme
MRAVEPFTRPHHVCVVVRDMDSAVSFYERVGIGPWHDYPPLEQYTQLDGVDRDAFLGLRYRYAVVGGLQLQLCQPGPGPSPQREFLDQKGEGVFQLGFEVPDVDAAGVVLEGLGVAPLMRGRRVDGSGFDYLDTAAEAGVVLLVRQTSADPGAGAPDVMTGEPS